MAIDPETLRAVFGIDPTVATRLLSQLVNVIQPDPRKPVDVASIDQALALIEGINPGDTIEAMTATMLVGAQHAALESLRRASHPDQTPAGRVLYQSLAFKAMRTFAQLLDTLYHGRGRGVTQQIIVKLSPQLDSPEEWEATVTKALEDYRTGRALMDQLGADRLLDAPTAGMLLAIRRGLIEETNATSASELVLIDMAVID